MVIERLYDFGKTIMLDFIKNILYTEPQLEGSIAEALSAFFTLNDYNGNNIIDTQESIYSASEQLSTYLPHAACLVLISYLAKVTLQKTNDFEGAKISHNKSFLIKSNETNTLEQKLNDLDSQYIDLQIIAKSIIQDHFGKIPFTPFSSKEKQRSSWLVNEVKELENYLKEKYAPDFSCIHWHGRMSWQRLIWQDQQFIQALSNPLIVKQIFTNANNKQETDIGGENFLSKIILYALADNRLSYLATAAPNLYNLPYIQGVTWSHLNSILVTKIEKECPLQISPAYIDSFTSAINSIKAVFDINALTLHSTMEIKKQKEINHSILKLSAPDLMSRIVSLLNDPQKLSKFTQGAAGSSTGPVPMNNQYIDVLTKYDDILKYHSGDHASVLGYGLISHALDARHLASALCFYNQKNNAYKLLTDLYNEELPPNALLLLKIRLQQIVSMIFGNSKKLEIRDPIELNNFINDSCFLNGSRKRCLTNPKESNCRRIKIK